MPNLRWKIVTVLAVLVVFSALGVYPIVAERYGINQPAWLMAKRLKLGLDLKGGVHLVLRVKTDDALRLQTEQDSERLREALSKAAITADHHDARRRPTSASKASRRRRTRRSARRRPRSRPTSTAAPAPAAPTRSR